MGKPLLKPGGHVAEHVNFRNLMTMRSSMDAENFIATFKLHVNLYITVIGEKWFESNGHCTVPNPGSSCPGLSPRYKHVILAVSPTTLML